MEFRVEKDAKIEKERQKWLKEKRWTRANERMKKLREREVHPSQDVRHFLEAKIQDFCPSQTPYFEAKLIPFPVY